MLKMEDRHHKTIPIYCQKQYDSHFRPNYIFTLCSLDFEPPSKVTKRDTSSSSVEIGWSPYSGEATLLGYRVLVLEQGRRETRKKRSLSQLEGELIRNFTVGPNTTAVEIQNLSAFSAFCVRVNVITKENGNGRLSECFYVYTAQDSKWWSIRTFIV